MVGISGERENNENATANSGIGAGISSPVGIGRVSENQSGVGLVVQPEAIERNLITFHARSSRPQKRAAGINLKSGTCAEHLHVSAHSELAD